MNNKSPKPCACGCGGLTKGGEFLPGHDSKLVSAIIAHVGGTANLRDLVEKYTDSTIEVKR